MKDTKNDRQWKRLVACLSLSLFSLFVLVGCGAPTYNVQIKMSPNMQTPDGVYPSLEVDMVAVNQDEATRFNSYSTDEYFQPNNAYRENLDKYTLLFSEEDFKPQTLSADNPIWAKWNKNGVTRLFIIGNLPGVWAIKSGKLDPRRLNLPLDSDSWPNGDNITIEIKPSGLSLLTPMKSPAAAAAGK